MYKSATVGFAVFVGFENYALGAFAEPPGLELLFASHGDVLQSIIAGRVKCLWFHSHWLADFDGFDASIWQCS